MKLDPRSMGGRKPAFHGRVMVDSVRGRIRVRKWPKKRGKNIHPNTRWWVEWFKQANMLAKYAAIPDQLTAKRVTENTPLMPRDMQLMAMRGRLFALQLPDGRVLYPMAAYKDVSESLDTITQTTGSILTRSGALWIPVEPGNPGDVLTTRGPGALPDWAPGGGGGTDFTPPQLPQWPIWVNQGETTIYQSAHGPMVISGATTLDAEHLEGRFKPLPPPPRTYIAGVRYIGEINNGNCAGIAIRDSTSEKLLTTHIRTASGFNRNQLEVMEWQSPLLKEGPRFQRQITPTDHLYLRIDDDGTAFHFSWSADLGTWLHMKTENRTAWLANADHIGLFLNFDSANITGTQALFWHYAEHTQTEEQS